MRHTPLAKNIPLSTIIIPISAASLHPYSETAPSVNRNIYSYQHFATTDDTTLVKHYLHPWSTLFTNLVVVPVSMSAIMRTCIAFILFTLLQTVASIPPPADTALLRQPPPSRLLPFHLQNVTHNSCCITPGLTFDPCTTTVPCAFGRYCVTPDSLHACPPGIVCICYPTRIVLCQDPAHCPLGETCAYRPSDHHPFCVSQNVVEVDPSYLIFRGGCVPCSTSRPPTLPPTSEPPTSTTTTVITSTRPTTQPSTTPPTSQPTSPSTKPPTAAPPSTRPPTSPSTRPPTSTPTRPPTRPPTAVQPSRRPTPSPLKSPPPSPRPSPNTPPPRPSRQPVLTVVPPSRTDRPRPTSSSAIRPSPTKSGGLAGDPCSDSSPCVSYRKCMRKDTMKECAGGTDCVCLGSRICVCNDQCTDNEVCAGAPGRSYCFSPDLIDSLSWSTTLPCVGPVISPEVGGRPRPPTTTAPPIKIPGLTGENCKSDTNCRTPRTCITGGGGTCLAGDSLCDKDPVPCKSSDKSCYCYDSVSCNCSNDCKDTEICTATTRGRMCVSRDMLEASEYLQEIECPVPGVEDGKAILIVNEVQPEPPAALTGTPRPTPSPVRIPGVTPEVQGQDASGSGGVCVDARALEHLDMRQLVFDKHPLAQVLCDVNDSCATPGHIVIYKEKPMMMKNYCAVAGCVSKVIPVNSPRLRRRVRIPSRTDDLHFTAFAARYETRPEELALATAVRVGL